MKSEIDSAKIFEIAAGVLILMIIVVAVSLIIPKKEKWLKKPLFILNNTLYN